MSNTTFHTSTITKLNLFLQFSITSIEYLFKRCPPYLTNTINNFTTENNNSKKMSEFEIPIGSLEEQALKRKERLRNLKRKAETKDQTSSKNSTNSGGVKENLPLPTQLKKNGPDELNGDENSEIALKNDDVISQITSEVDTLKTPIVIEDIDIQNLAPRKPDWDLKRDVAKKLEILDRRTQRAIAEIIRDRLRSNEGDVDLQAVNAVGYTTQSENP